MNYALNLDVSGRILSACVVMPRGNYVGMPIVNVLPDGDVSDYLFVNGQYVHDPLPMPEQPEAEATTDDVLNALLGVTV